ncbi:hypothetical protein pb186bvf_005370 [Paramecium bursaria]
MILFSFVLILYINSYISSGLLEVSYTSEKITPQSKAFIIMDFLVQSMTSSACQYDPMHLIDLIPNQSLNSFITSETHNMIMPSSQRGLAITTSNLPETLKSKNLKYQLIHQEGILLDGSLILFYQS